MSDWVTPHVGPANEKHLLKHNSETDRPSDHGQVHFLKGIYHNCCDFKSCTVMMFDVYVKHG